MYQANLIFFALYSAGKEKLLVGGLGKTE